MTKIAAVDFEPNNLKYLSNLETCTNEEPRHYIMDRIGITNVRSRDKMIEDGYGSTQSIITTHSNNCNSIKKYLNMLNKMYATARFNIQVYYSPKIIVRFAALLLYYNQAVKGIHQILDLSYLELTFIWEITEIQ